MSSIRTFIAFDTPKEIKNKIELLQTELKKSNANVRWEPVEKFHVTIKFLGNVSEKLVSAVIMRIQSTVEKHFSFSVCYEGLGCFPNTNNPRVIWVGVKSIDDELGLLKDSLDKELHQLGFEIEKRAFHPHITLGRVKNENGLKNLIPMLKSLNFQPERAIVKEILVMKSILKPEGSVYSILKAIPLKTKDEFK